MSEFRDEAESVFGKKPVNIAIVILIIALIYGGISFVGHLWPFSSAAGVIQKTTSAEAIISNYEYFYDMKSAIDATTMKYKIAKKAGKDETVGIQMVLVGMIQEYNARSKMVTRNMWKAKDLPYQIDEVIE